MSLGSEVVRAIRRTDTDEPRLRVYECSGCGRAFARDHDYCPACNGPVDAIVLH